MKILIDGRFYGLEHAGIGRYSMNLIDELAKKDSINDYVVLLAPKYFKILNLPKNWTKVSVKFRHYTITEQLSLPFIIAQHKPDFCHFLHFNVPVFYFGKFVVTLHDMEMHKSKGKDATTRSPFYYRFLRAGYGFVFANAAKRAMRIIVPTNEVKREIVAYYNLDKDKVTVTYEGVNANFFETVSAKSTEKVLKKYGLVDKKYFFYNGNAYPHKNLPIAISAVASLYQKQKTIFVIASSRSVFGERLRELVEKQALERVVKIIGFVSDEELAVLHKNSVAFVYPSLMEGFGLQGLETMAAGTLLCASDIPIFREIYKDNAIYFEPSKQEAIKQALTNAINISTKEREDRLIKARAHAKNFSWGKMAEETLKVYSLL